MLVVVYCCNVLAAVVVAVVAVVIVAVAVAIAVAVIVLVVVVNFSVCVHVGIHSLRCLSWFNWSRQPFVCARSPTLPASVSR